MIGFIKTTIVGGILVILPFAFLAFLAAEAFDLSVAVTRSIDGVFPIRTYLGLAAINVLAAILFLSVCFIAGLLVRLAFVAERIHRLDQGLSQLVPGYSVAKTALGGADAETSAVEDLTAVRVERDGVVRVGLEVERSQNGLVIVFFPNAPNHRNGSIEAVPDGFVHELSVSSGTLMNHFQELGRGLGAVIDEQQAASSGDRNSSDH